MYLRIDKIPIRVITVSTGLNVSSGLLI